MTRHNMGKPERLGRFLLGTLLFLFSLWEGMNGFFLPEVVLALTGLVIALTGLFSYCPVNALLRHNSCKACRSGETHVHQPV